MARLAPIFRETEILLAGANGFLGKVLLALLLDRFPEVRRLHVLVRPRSGLSGADRFEREVLDSPPLQPLLQKAGRQALRERINILSGDASMPLAGLAASQVSELGGRIGLVLNCAGLVDFFPPVELSLRANVDSVARFLELCNQLDAKLLHVSTCYVAGEADGLVEETEPVVGYYPRRSGPGDASFNAAAVLDACRAAAAAAGEGLQAAERTAALAELGRVQAAKWGWVNTYTFTKSLGEQVLAAQSEVPYAIVRPAIVESALHYPFPGWIEGGRTAAPLALMALGGLLDWPARRDLSLEVVPVDLVAAGILAVAGALLRGTSGQVYQLASSDLNPYPLEDLIDLLCREARSNGSQAGKHPLWLDPLPRLRFLSPLEADRRRDRQRARIRRARRLLERSGRSARAAQLRILELQLGFHEETFRQYLPFIHAHRYVFETVNIRRCYEQLDAADRDLLPWNPAAINWPEYWRDCQLPGIRQWVQPEAVRQWAFQI